MGSVKDATAGAIDAASASWHADALRILSLTVIRGETAKCPGKTRPPSLPQRRNPKPPKPKAGKGPQVESIKVHRCAQREKAQILSSEVVYEGPLFRVLHDKLIEPGGKHSERDVIRHNGSVVILALDNSKSKKDPWIVMERQYRHAANQYLWELPAGKLDPGEDPLAGAQRELEEETGYRAKKWKPLVEYYASPGFLGESMKVFLAEGLMPATLIPKTTSRSNSASSSCPMSSR